LPASERLSIGDLALPAPIQTASAEQALAPATGYPRNGIEWLVKEFRVD
jgi:hypothetical protein